MRRSLSVLFAACAIQWVSCPVSFGQSSLPKAEYDSLWAAWSEPALADTQRIKAMQRIAYWGYLNFRPDTTVILADKIIEFAESRGQYKFKAIALNTKGAGLVRTGDLKAAMECFVSSIKLFEKLGMEHKAAPILINLSVVHESQNDTVQAMSCLRKAIEICKRTGDTKNLGIAYLGIANVYDEGTAFDIRTHYLNLCLEANLASDYESGYSYALIGLGNVLCEQGHYDEGIAKYHQAILIHEKLGDFHALAQAQLNLGAAQLKMGRNAKAIVHGRSALEIAQTTGSIEAIRHAANLLFRAFKETGDHRSALMMHELFIQMRDSITNEENQQEVLRQQMNFDFEKKEALAQAEQEKKDAIALQELQRQKMARNGFMGGFAVVFLFAGVFFVQRNRIGKEKERSEELLLNILPSEVAEELKAKGEAEAQLIDEATVLFTDFKGFTQLSETLSPQELVADLNECFSAFDRICGKYGIEKIKTIGDSYMAAGGLPTPCDDHAQRVVRAALEMSAFISERDGGRRTGDEGNAPLPSHVPRPSSLQIRIGIHTGPVVAGIVGVKKFQYDIWGDTVNTASRMESSGEVGKVNISEATYALVKDDFECEFRGEIEAKGKGKMGMYFVSQRMKT
jgi:adenylate cyclase